MADYRALSIKLLTTDGKVSARHIKLLKKFLFVDSNVPEEDLEFLGGLRDALLAQRGRVNPRFESFYLKCVQARVLANGAVGTGEVEWLSKHLLADATIKSPAKKKFLNELKARASATAPEFDDLYHGLVKKPKRKPAADATPES
jgi:hypothetical protein